MAAVDEALTHDTATPLQRIRGHLLKLAIEFSDPGQRGASLFTKATVELADRDSDVARSAAHAFTQLAAIYRQCIVAAQEATEIDPGADPDALASFFLALTRGMEVLGNAGTGRAGLTSVALTSVELVAPSR